VANVQLDAGRKLTFFKMLLNTFFKIAHIETIEPQHYRILAMLAPNHRIYDGHFPENPIVPGVCSLHMLVECIGIALGYPVLMIGASVVKFREILQPSRDGNLEIDLYIDGAMTAKAVIVSGERTVLSCRMKLTKMEEEKYADTV
jgi:3-hydroxyacyl-[acyl-carrier-protein] dehydratase